MAIAYEGCCKACGWMDLLEENGMCNSCADIDREWSADADADFDMALYNESDEQKDEECERLVREANLRIPVEAYFWSLH